MGIAKEIRHRINTYVGVPTNNGSTSDETDVLLDSRIGACYYQLQRHFDRQLREARVFTSLASSCLPVCERSLYSFLPRRPNFDTRFTFRVHLLDSKSIYRHSFYKEIASIRRLP